MIGRRARASLAVCAIVAAAGAFSHGAAFARERERADAAPRWWLAIEPFAGSVRLDPHLGDYLWNVEPRLVWGGQLVAHRGGAGVGARVWRASTAQSSGIPGESIEPSVRLTAAELVGEWRLLSAWGVGVAAVASGGRLHVGYAPDRATFVPPGSSVAVEVAYEPIDAWTGGAGLALRRPIAARLALGARVERSFFALDTAHRNGESIETRRETFANWSARLELSWRLPLG